MNAFSAGKRHVYDSVNPSHFKTIPFPKTAKFMFVGVRNNKTQHVRC